MPGLTVTVTSDTANDFGVGRPTHADRRDRLRARHPCRPAGPQGANYSTLKAFVQHLEGEQRPYNVAVLPAEKGQVWVYLGPAPTKPNVWPLGGDVRYLISADGTKIVSKRQLHKAVIEVEPPKDRDNQLVAGMHTHVLDDIPEDTDVFHVLTRKPAVPELVITKQFVFQVGPDGTIQYVGKVEDVLKK